MDNRSITIVVQSLIYIFANHKPASNKGTCITEVVSTCGGNIYCQTKSHNPEICRANKRAVLKGSL